MTTYRIPRECSWQINSELRLLQRDASYDLNREFVFETRDGVLYAFEDITVAFYPLPTSHGLIVGTLREGALDLFTHQNFTRSDVADECSVCGSASIHKRMLVAETPKGLMMLHPRCSGYSDSASLTRDLARKIDGPTKKSQAWPVEQLIRIALLVAGKDAAGFMSRAKSAGGEATSDKVIALLTGQDKTIYTPHPELDDEVQETLELARDLESGATWSNRIRAAAQSTYTSEVGLTVSMLILLQSKRREESAPKGFVEAYEFPELKLTVESRTSDVEYWGYNSNRVEKIRFMTEDGRAMFWKTSGSLGALEDAGPDDQFTLVKAILKKKSTWRGCDTTEIKNAKFREV